MQNRCKGYTFIATIVTQMTPYIVLLDYGHGAIDHKGAYHCLANGKIYRHPDYVAYEGVLNREIGDKVEKALSSLGIDYRVISDDILDLPLSSRVLKANTYHKQNPNSFVVSLHCNASPRHNAQGYEVYTSPGQTQSDKLAEYHYQFVAALLPNTVKMRSDTYTDGDNDKEARFHILARTQCPAILIEHLFFDNPTDIALLRQEVIQQNFADATAYACKAFIEHLEARKW